MAFFVAQEMIKASAPYGDQKISPQSTQRPQRIFFKRAKTISRFVNISSPLRPPCSLRWSVILGIRKIPSLDFPRMKIRKSARRIARAQRTFSKKPFALMGLRGIVGREAAFSLALLAFNLFCLCVLCDLCG
jgi:hypothetical protein